MTEKELDKLEAADQWMANVASMADGSEYGERMVEYIRAHLAAQRQAANAGIPDVNGAVYGYLDKKALKANERERDLLAGFYFYLQECGYISAQRQAPADSAAALEWLNNASVKYEYDNFLKHPDIFKHLETIRAALLSAQGGVPGDAITGDTSDGYHTFNELYEHRHALFMAVVKAYPDKAWKSWKHDDGSMMEGWFIAGIETPKGHATYHLPESHWEDFSANILDRAPKWDGHTSADVIKRIRSLTPYINNGRGGLRRWSDG